MFRSQGMTNFLIGDVAIVRNRDDADVATTVRNHEALLLQSQHKCQKVFMPCFLHHIRHRTFCSGVTPFELLFCKRILPHPFEIVLINRKRQPVHRF